MKSLLFDVPRSIFGSGDEGQESHPVFGANTDTLKFAPSSSSEALPRAGGGVFLLGHHVPRYSDGSGVVPAAGAGIGAFSDLRIDPDAVRSGEIGRAHV